VKQSSFAGYYVVPSTGEDRLWTVGVELPWNGAWEPESDHGSEREAKQRAWLLNGIEARYAYWRSEPGLWTVFDGANGGEPESDHGSEADAANEVIRLNA
jgi:hypothetical protein